MAIIAFGLGIGANASVYSTLRAMVLHPVPFKELDRVLLVGVVRLDLPILAALTILLGLAGALAGYLPARRAAQIDPLVALREE